MIKKGINMIKVNDLCYSFPQKDLYDKISFTIEDGQHCAFIGTSGSGKSTLADLIMDPEKYMFDGTVELALDCKMGYVSQFSITDKTKEVTVFEFLGEESINLQNELTSICAEMETSPDIDPLLEKYQQTLDAFNAIDGDNFESNINKKLNLAGLNNHRDLMVSELSGGEFKLLQVIKVMLSRPDFIIMDEPDAYLDFLNINALRNLINSYKGTLLIITHSRYLLNHCFNKILHLENKELQEFDGRYIDYNFSLLQNKIELQEIASAEAEEIERTELLINQLRSNASYYFDASKGKTLHARVKIRERLEARRIKAPFVNIKQPKISFSTDKQAEETIALKITDYRIAFDEVLLENINFEIKSTDKVALVGPNGTGKTTLLREIYKNNHASIELNTALKTAYLSQIQGEMLDESNTILNEFFDAGFQTNQEIILYLSKYGFEEEALNQKIGSLSGGEKNTIQLAKIAAAKADLLLLDEPASHLDTYSQIALEKALENYKGALIMISHDFYSIVNCTDYILLIEDKTIRKVSTRKFRKMIYASYFDRDYLDIEQKKKSIETKIELALKNNEFTLAKTLSEELEPLIQLL